MLIPTQKAVDAFVNNGWTPQQLEAQGYITDGAPTASILEALRGNGSTDESLVAAGYAAQGTDAVAEKPDAKVSRFVSLRDEIKQRKDDLKVSLKPMEEEMETLQGHLGALLTDTGQTTMSSASGTFFFVDKVQVGTERYEDFQQWFVGTIINSLSAKKLIVDGKSYEAQRLAMESLGLGFMTQAVRKDAVVEYTAEHGTPPPGLKIERFQEVQVRRPTGKATKK